MNKGHQRFAINSNKSDYQLHLRLAKGKGGFWRAWGYQVFGRGQGDLGQKIIFGNFTCWSRAESGPRQKATVQHGVLSQGCKRSATVIYGCVLFCRWSVFIVKSFIPGALVSGGMGVRKTERKPCPPCFNACSLLSFYTRAAQRWWKEVSFSNLALNYRCPS